MKTIRAHRRLASFVGAVVLSLQMSPAMAGGQLDNQRPVAITFTKWVRVVNNIAFLEGFTGGDVVGAISGEVFRSQLSSDVGIQIQLIDTVYRVTADQPDGPSFAALIRGGRTNTLTGGDALLDGFILEGWRTGARVHVEFQKKVPASLFESACDGAPAGLTCFEGTIHVGRAPGD